MIIAKNKRTIIKSIKIISGIKKKLIFKYKIIIICSRGGHLVMCIKGHAFYLNKTKTSTQFYLK